MNMAQIVAVGLIGTILCITIKEQKPEISLLIAVTTGVLIFISVCTKLEILLCHCVKGNRNCLFSTIWYAVMY